MSTGGASQKKISKSGKHDKAHHSRRHHHRKHRGGETVDPTAYANIFANPTNFINDEGLNVPEYLKKLHTESGNYFNKNRINESLFQPSKLPWGVLTDSYKLSHGLMYSPAKKMVAYGECRGPIKIYDKKVGKEIGINNEYRIVSYGIRYIIENYIDKIMTEEDVNTIKAFFSTHALGFPYPFDSDTFDTLKGNKPPIKIYALQEGTVVLPHTPIYQIVAEKPYAPLVTFFETVLTMVWYPISVATLSRCCRQIFEDKLREVELPGWIESENAKETRKLYNPAGNQQQWWIEYMLQDFGFRGATCLEQTIIGGSAHLLNFKGSDTMSASFYSQIHLNDGKTTGESIAASEHSVMTSYQKEVDAMYNILKKFGTKGAVAIVMDSYNYENSLRTVFPAAVLKFYDDIISKEKPIQLPQDEINKIKGTELQNKINLAFKNEGGKGKKKVKGGGSVAGITIIEELPNFLQNIHNEKIITDRQITDIEEASNGLFAVTFRPDSGDPVEAVLQALYAGLATFGIDKKYSYKSSKGIYYIKPKFIRVIQGDGINVFTLKDILNAVTKPQGDGKWAFSPFSVLFGMGGGLLQKVNRDTVNFATKLCHVDYEDGSSKTVMKDPSTDPDKRSLPGELYVIKEKMQSLDVPKANSIDNHPTYNIDDPNNLLKLAYSKDTGLTDKFKKGDDKNSYFEIIRDRVDTEWSALKGIIGSKERQLDGRSPSIIELQESTSDALKKNTNPQDNAQYIEEQYNSKIKKDVLINLYRTIKIGDKNLFDEKNVKQSGGKRKSSKSRPKSDSHSHSKH
jgi:nicotinic acid phosphoribosyltransferase